METSVATAQQYSMAIRQKWFAGCFLRAGWVAVVVAVLGRLGWRPEPELSACLGAVEAAEGPHITELQVVPGEKVGMGLLL